MNRNSLIADIGATNARFALLSGDGEFERVRVQACEDHPSLHEAIAAYLREEMPHGKLRAAALAIAGPVSGEHAALTNHPWSFSLHDLRREMAIEQLLLVNDFMAIAAAIPDLAPSHRVAVGGGDGVAATPIGALGPGSGLGVSALVPVNDRWLPLAGEGGHVTMAPATARESSVLDRMRQRFDHVSAERVLSGPGLVHLYEMLAEIDGVPAASYTPAQVADAKTQEREPRCREAVDMFCAMLGTIAGNLALTLGARGGIYVAGGIVPRLGARFAVSEFRRRFEEKGRMRALLAGIPTYIVTHPFPAFVGLANALSPAGNVMLVPGANCAESRDG